MAGQTIASGTLGKYVAIELTGTCPCHCSFCYKITKEGCSFALDNETSIRTFLTTLKNGGVESINWTGGEPTWHSMLPTILRIAKEEEYGFTNILSTCGLLPNHKRIKEKDILKYWQTIQFVLDYVSISHDGLHSHQQPEAARQFLKWYREGRFSFRLKVNTLVGKQNGKMALEDIANDILPTVCVWNLIEYVPREHSTKTHKITWVRGDEIKKAFAETIDGYRGKCMAIPVFKLHKGSDPYHILLVTPSGKRTDKIAYWLPENDGYLEFDPDITSTKQRWKLSKGKTVKLSRGCQFDSSANNDIYARYEHSGFETEYFRFILHNISNSVRRLLLEGWLKAPEEKDEPSADDIASPYLDMPKSLIGPTTERYKYLCEKLFVHNERFAAFVREVAGIYYAGLFYREYHDAEKLHYTRYSITQVMDGLFVSPAFFPTVAKRNAWLTQSVGADAKDYDGLKALDNLCELTYADGNRVGKGLTRESDDSLHNTGELKWYPYTHKMLVSWQFMRLAAGDESGTGFRVLGTLDNLELWTYYSTKEKPGNDPGKEKRFRLFISFMEGVAVFLLQYAHSKFTASKEASRLEQERAETLRTVDDRVIQLIDDIETLKSSAVTLRHIVQPDGPVFCERAKELIPLFDHGKQVGLILTKVKDNKRVGTSHLETEITNVASAQFKPSDYFVEITRYTPSVDCAVRLTSSHSTESVDQEHFESFQKCILAFGTFADIPLLRALGSQSVAPTLRSQFKALVKLLCQRQMAPSETKDKVRVIYDAQLVCYLCNEFSEHTVQYNNKSIAFSNDFPTWTQIAIPEESSKNTLTLPVGTSDAPVVAMLHRLNRPIDVLAPLCALVKELSQVHVQGEARIDNIVVESTKSVTTVHLNLDGDINVSNLHDKTESLEGRHGLSSPLHRLCNALGQEHIRVTARPLDTPGLRIVTVDSKSMIELVFEKNSEWTPHKPTESNPL